MIKSAISRNLIILTLRESGISFLIFSLANVAALFYFIDSKYFSILLSCFLIISFYCYLFIKKKLEITEILLNLPLDLICDSVALLSRNEQAIFINQNYKELSQKHLSNINLPEYCTGLEIIDSNIEKAIKAFQNSELKQEILLNINFQPLRHAKLIIRPYKKYLAILIKSLGKNHFDVVKNICDDLKIPVLIFNNNLVEYNNTISDEFNNPEQLFKEFTKHKHIIHSDKTAKRFSIKSFNYSPSFKINFLSYIDEYEVIWSFLERSTVGSAIADLNLNIIKSNHNFKQITNLDLTPLKGQGNNFLDLIRKEDIDKIQHLISVRLRNEYLLPVDIGLKIENKNLLLHINTIDTKQEKYLVLTVIDMTKYKTLEINFVHSQKMQAVGQLAGAIAHDFNNLLTAMMGFCDLLSLRHPPGDKSFNDIMQIKQNVNRAANLVRQLLAFSRKQVLQPSVLEVTNVIAELSNLINRLIGENIELVIEHGKDLDYIKVDQGQLEQVIINLAVNARDAMPNGGILKISASNIHINETFDESEYYIPVGDDTIAPGDYVLIRISDTGEGIDSTVLDKIFEPFFSTKAMGAGTGLGLSTVYGIIKQTGGYIRLITQQNVGTSFFIYFKAIKNVEELKSQCQTLNDTTEEQAIRLFDKDNFQCGKILIVEDEAPVRMLTSQALTNKGYKVLNAENASKALDLFDSEGANIDMVITDVMMPGMTGPQMIEQMREKHPNIKVIFISGYAEDALNNHNLNQNSYFLAKPFTLSQLATKVKDVILNNKSK